MAGHRARRLAVRLALVCVALPAVRAAEEEGPASLRPGFATVEMREERQVRLRLDREAGVDPAQLQGQTVTVRRQTKEVYFPQSYRLLAEHWAEIGAGEVLPTSVTGGALVARILWEDPQNPIKSMDRVERCRGPADAAKPVILAVRCRTSRGVADLEGVALAPSDEVLLEATVFCPTADPASCTWTADVGEFLQPGGPSAGKTVRGPTVVRWRPIAASDAGGAPAAQASLRLDVAAGASTEATTKTFSVRIAEPKGAYAKSQQLTFRTPLFTEVSALAPGPLGSFYLLDAKSQRLVHWTPSEARHAATAAGATPALAAFGGSAYILQGNSLLSWTQGADAPAASGSVPSLAEVAALALNAFGDLCVLEGGGVPRIRILSKGADGAWQEARTETGIASPGLTHFGVDPLSNDVYAFNSQDGALRQWRATSGTSYRPVGAPIRLEKIVQQYGPVVAVLLNPQGSAAGGLPPQLVFQSGAVTESWAAEGNPPAWAPNVVRAPAPLSNLQFAVHRAALLPDGDYLLGGQTRAAGQAGPLVAQVSPQGELRRMLPLPPLAPRLVAVAPGGRRYLLLGDRSREGGERLVVVDSDGWLCRDIGAVKACQSIVALRADRSSPDHVFAVGQAGRRASAVRLDAANPLFGMELASAGLPGQRVPDHDAVDVASSPEHVAVLDRGGKVLLFANTRPVKYLGEFETRLRRPKAIAVLSNVARRGASDPDRRSYVCVLPSDPAAVHLWEIRLAAGPTVAATPLGLFPDPQKHPAGALLASPTALDTGFPDQPERLFVLDRSGTQLRTFDVAEIAYQLSQQHVPEIPAASVADALPFQGEPHGMAIGPGGAVHVVDGPSESLHSFTRQP